MKPFQLPRWRLLSCCGHDFGYEGRGEAPRAGATRRDFIKGGLLGIAAVSARPALPARSAAQGRMYPPPPATLDLPELPRVRSGVRHAGSHLEP